MSFSLTFLFPDVCIVGGSIDCKVSLLFMTLDFFFTTDKEKEAPDNLVNDCLMKQSWLSSCDYNIRPFLSSSTGNDNVCWQQHVHLMETVSPLSFLWRLNRILSIDVLHDKMYEWPKVTFVSSNPCFSFFNYLVRGPNVIMLSFSVQLDNKLFSSLSFKFPSCYQSISSFVITPSRRISNRSLLKRHETHPVSRELWVGCTLRAFQSNSPFAVTNFDTSLTSSRTSEKALSRRKRERKSYLNSLQLFPALTGKGIVFHYESL